MARETLQHDSRGQHEQELWHLEGNGTRSLERREAVGIVMTSCFVVDRCRDAGSFDATLEQAALKRRRAVGSISLGGLDCPLACEPEVGKGTVRRLQTFLPARSRMTNELSDGFVAAQARRRSDCDDVASGRTTEAVLRPHLP